MSKEIELTVWEEIYDIIRNNHSTLEIESFMRDKEITVDMRGGKIRQTLLHITCQLGKTEITQWLIDNDANVSTVDAWANTALATAIDLDQPGCMKILFSNPKSCTVIMKEVMQNYHHYIEKIVATGNEELSTCFLSFLRDTPLSLPHDMPLDIGVATEVELWCNQHYRSSPESFLKLQQFLFDAGYDATNLYGKVYGYDDSHILLGNITNEETT
ncbi:MAG: hypothetical protein KA998_01015 [Rickettsiaceae bacterium]|nr:hypothetical protein [Rickettsiaceae bacterium]